MKRDANGRWLPGQSANPIGPRILAKLTPGERKARERRRRAETARQQAQASVTERFQREVRGVSEATITAALAGDSAAQRLVLERVSPAPRYESPPLVIEGIDADAETASAAIMAALAAGRISVEKAELYLNVVRARTEISFTSQVAEKLERLRINLTKRGLASLVPISFLTGEGQRS